MKLEEFVNHGLDEEKKEIKSQSPISKPGKNNDAEIKIASTDSFTEGFVIQEVEICNFMRYLDKTSIDFPHKYTVITGKTGSGKTSILDAITFALYKSTSRTDVKGIKIEDVCRSSGYARVAFKHGRDSYEITRGLSSSGAPRLEISKNSRLIEGSIPEKDRIIQEIIGLDYLGFRNSTFIRQEEMKELGSETGSRRMEIFQKLFRLEIFQKAQELAEKKFYELEAKIAAAEERLKSDADWLSEAKAAMPRKGEEIKQLEILVAREQKKGSELKHALESKEEEFKALQARHEEYVRVKLMRAETERAIETAKRKLLEAQQKQKSAEELKNKIAQMQSETKHGDEIKEEKERLEKLKKQTDELKLELQYEEQGKKKAELDFEREKSRHDVQMRQLEGRVAKLSTSLNREEAFALLRREGALSERLERIAKEITWLADKKELVRELESERKEAEQFLLKVSGETKKINADSFLLSEIQNQMNQRQEELKERELKHQNEIKIKNDNIARIKNEILCLGFDEKKFAEIAARAAKLEKQKKELEALRLELEKTGDMEKLIEELARQLRDYKRKSEELHVQLAALEAGEKEYGIVKSEIEALRSSFNEMEKKISELRGRKAALQSSLEEEGKRIRQLEEKIKQEESRLKKLREDSEVLAILKNSIFHKKGIAMYAVNQLLPQLAIEASQNLAELTDGRFSKLRLTPYEENRSFGIRIEVEGSDGLFHEVQEFSGGEKTQINAALRFAIAKELAGMPQIGRSFAAMRTLFIDEGDLGSLDSEVSRELFVRKLFSMGKFFDRIILITHLNEVAERFPGKIRIYMTPEEKSCAEVLS